MQAQDLAQEAYLRLLRLEDHTLIRDPQAYLFRIASNLVHEFALKYPTRLTPGDVGDEPVTAPDAPEQALDMQVRARYVKSALDELLPKCRAVLILHRRDEMTYEQIATHLGISVSMVKKYLGIALKRCRASLRDLAPERRDEEGR